VSPVPFTPGAPAAWPDVAVLVRPEPSSVVPIPAAIPFVCRPRPNAWSLSVVRDSRKNPRRSGEGSGRLGLRRQRLSLRPVSRREPVMSTNTRSIPSSSERSRPRTDTSTRPRSSTGTWTRRPSALMAMATRPRFLLLNRPTWSSVASAHRALALGVRPSVSAEVKPRVTPRSGSGTKKVSPARRDTEANAWRRPSHRRWHRPIQMARVCRSSCLPGLPGCP